MEVVALFMPACIAMAVKQRRGGAKTPIAVLIEYGCAVLWCNLLTVSVITYILGIGEVQSDALNSFPFFTKYVLIAIVFAFIVPYLCEVAGRYIKIKFLVQENK